MNRYFNPIDWAFSFSSASAFRHLFSPPYILYYIIWSTLCQAFITLYLVFYSQFYQHLVDNIKKPPGHVPGGKNRRKLLWLAGSGFEPPTSGLWAQRASRLLHPAVSPGFPGIYANKRGFKPPAECLWLPLYFNTDKADKTDNFTLFSVFSNSHHVSFFLDNQDSYYIPS